MKKWLVAVAAAMSIYCSYLHGEELLRSCEDTANDNSYRLLNEYFATEKIVNRWGMYCQRLNNHEFIYSAVGDGYGVVHNGNIYYCNSDEHKPLTCVEHDYMKVIANASVASRFRGERGKQFVLLKTEAFTSGNHSEQYHAFYLVPKNINQRGYAIFSFFGAGAEYAGSNVKGKICEFLNPNMNAITPLSPPFEIVNEDSADMAIRFNQIVTNCKTGEKSKQTLEFAWQNGSFQQAKNKFVRMKAGH